jgi:dTDP-4-amino-4,6-dideoxygalactose transaminase
VPLHLQDVYARLRYKSGDFPISEQLAQEVLSLPIYPELMREEQEYIVETIVKFYSRGKIKEPVIHRP